MFLPSTVHGVSFPLIVMLLTFLMNLNQIKVFVMDK